LVADVGQSLPNTVSVYEKLVTTLQAGAATYDLVMLDDP